MKVNVYNIEGEKVGMHELPKKISDTSWNPSLVQQIYLGEQANARRPWAHSKDRSEVRGGGRKPWRQKGLGRARHGSIRSPIWIGGGVTHGPRKQRNYQVKLNKKMKRASLFSVLARKIKEDEFILIDRFLPGNKTKDVAKIFKGLREKAEIKRIATKGGKTLLAIPLNKELKQATKNLTFVDYIEPRNLNTSKLLGNKYVVFDKASIHELEKTYAI